MMEGTVQQFCGNTTFFERELFWNSSYPQFTDCFQNTAVVWVPCGFLWLVLPLYLHVLSTSLFPPFHGSRLYRVKIILSLLLAAISGRDLVARYINSGTEDDTIVARYTADGIKMVTFLLVAWLMILERRKGLITSGVLFVFWFLSSVAGLVPIYSHIIKQDGSESLYDLVPVLGSYSLVLIQLVLSCYAEKPPMEGYMQSIHTNKKPKPSPEIEASFLSRLTYSWITPLIRQVYNTGEVEKDVWDLNPDDRSSTLDPTFQQAWDDEMKKYKQRIKQSSHQQPSEEVSSLNDNSVDTTSDDKNNNIFDEGNKRNTTFNNSSSNNDSNNNNSKAKSDKSNSTEEKERDEKANKAEEVRGPSLVKTLYKVAGKTILLAWANKFAFDVMQLTTPLVLKMLIDYIERKNEGDPSVYPWQGYVCAAMLFTSAILTSVFGMQNHRLGHLAGMRMNSALVTAIYRKMLTISHESRSKSTVGEIVNLMSADASHIRGICGFLWVFWSAPFLLVASLVMLWHELGPAALASLVIFTLLLPLNSFIATQMRNLHLKQMELKDSRIKAMTEVLNGIKVMKLYAWETSFEKMVMDIREKEIAVFKKKSYYIAVHSFVWVSAPILVCVAVFSAYIASDSNNYMDGQKAFVALALFEVLSSSINLMPHAFNTYTQAKVSLGRIGDFLQSSDLDPNNVELMNTADVSISVEDGTFSWGKRLEPVLNDINVTIPTGGLVAVVGAVGAGKSSLLSAFLGEMDKKSGLVRVKGSTVYVPQQAWIQNITFRDNILFGQRLNDHKYQQVVDACALKPDIELFKGGDLTEIGEKGITLSGGQKQRVSLARAVYNNADVYLLDDPLSAVDSHVGKHIFEKVIGPRGLLRNKTRVLVTQGVHWLPYVDNIIVLKDGRVSEVGSYKQLLDHDGAFAQFLKTYIAEANSDDSDEEVQRLKTQFQTKEDNEDDDSDTVLKLKTNRNKCRRQLFKSISMYGHDNSDVPEKKGHLEKLIEDEKMETGRISSDVYKTYIRAVGYLPILAIILTFAGFKLADVGSTVKLAAWTDDSHLRSRTHANETEQGATDYQHLAKYAAFGFIQTCCIVVFNLISNICMMKAACKLHDGMLKNILKMPMSFFDTTPTGRIINRFSKDVETVDEHFKNSLRDMLCKVFDVISIISGICYTTPIFICFIVPLGVLYRFVQQLFAPAFRQLKRIESVTGSPIFSHFQESIQGVSTIRAYKLQNRFAEESQERLDSNFACMHRSAGAFFCLSVRMQFLANLIILAAALLAIATPGVSGGLMGLSITWAFQSTHTMLYMMNSLAELDKNAVSVERVKEYSEKETEAEWVRPNHRPQSGWPRSGNMKFNNYKTRYRAGLDLVLHGITCEIKGGEKVGIVGRSGAGKSSLTVALFRIIEAASGSITIDGEDIADMGLHDLRSNLTILPQDPVLFSGTLKMNLDPFSVSTEEQLWVALEHAHLKTFVQGLPDKLQHECGEGGQNLSVGQRQLVCLARTLLKKTKVLVLDEATAAVDMTTDDLIQKTIREEFQDTTILTIAHRLNTVMDYDKIMVLDKGQIKEFDSPRTLLEDTSSDFYSMAQASGLV